MTQELVPTSIESESAEPGRLIEPKSTPVSDRSASTDPKPLVDPAPIQTGSEDPEPLVEPAAIQFASADSGLVDPVEPGPSVEPVQAPIETVSADPGPQVEQLQLRLEVNLLLRPLGPRLIRNQLLG